MNRRGDGRQAPEGRPEASSRGRRLVFSFVAATIPVVFFALLEGGLRIAGYGESYPLFVPVPGVEDVLVQNRDVARRYFSQQVRVPTGIGDTFAAEKDLETYRIFVQGGSSAAGYPYYFGGSFSRMLEQRLQQTFPQRVIEVVNTSMAAVNSYTLLDLVPEIVAHSPDAVLIYAGHNEFYGALGVGSAESVAGSRLVTRLYLRLQKWRTVQLLQAGLAGTMGLFGGQEAGEVPGATLMERMVREQEIPLESPVYRAGIDQFRQNLRDLLAAYREAGVPVFIGTVASNERDHAPFSSAPESDTTSALAAFTHGRRLDAQGRFREAREAYVRAKDRDRLRFRAPEDINRVIRLEASAANATVVETRAALAASAPGGIIDGTLMLEHLHPNVEGYFLIADAFYEALREAGEIEAGWTPTSRADAYDEILLTPVDSLYGSYRVLQLMGSWPFRPPGSVWADTLTPRSPLEEITVRLFRGETSWFEATSTLRALQESEGDWHEALKTTLAQIQQFPFLPGPYAAAGQILLRQRRGNEALTYFGAALEIEESAAVRGVMGDIHAALGQDAEASEAFGAALSLEPDNADFALKLGRSHAILGDSTSAARVLRRFLEGNPDDQRVQRVLAALESAIKG